MEYFDVFSADDDLGEAMVVAIAALFTVSTGFNNSPANKCFLYLQIDFFRNNGFGVAFYIVLRHQIIILHYCFAQKVCGVGFWEQSISAVFLVSGNLVDGNCVPSRSTYTGENAVTLKSGSDLVHVKTFQVFSLNALYDFCLFRANN